MHPNLLENVAIAMGRLAGQCAPRIAPLVDTFASQWLLALGEVSSPEDRDVAFRGLLALCAAAWAPLLARYPEVLAAFASWSYYDYEPAPDLVAGMQQLITAAAAAQVGGADPSAFLSLLEENYREYLTKRFTF